VSVHLDEQMFRIAVVFNSLFSIAYTNYCLFLKFLWRQFMRDSLIW